MQAKEAVDRPTDDAAAILVGLASHLQEHYGLQAELYEDSTPSPQLLVTQAGMDTTSSLRGGASRPEKAWRVRIR